MKNRLHAIAILSISLVFPLLPKDGLRGEAADPNARQVDIPAGKAENTLKRLSTQSRQ